MGKAKVGIITGIIALIIVIVVIFNFVGTSSSNLKTAADSITDANNCTATDSSGGKIFYNNTDKYCYNSTAGGKNQLYLAKQYDLPLNSLFSSSGVVLLILLASILIFIVGLVLKSARKK